MSPLFVSFLIALIIVVIVLFRYWWIEEGKKIDARERLERGIHKEQEAKGFLKSQGYKIVEEQKEYIHAFYVDGELVESPVVIDYLVRKGGQTYVVEVKSGKKATSYMHAPTRRQILEYAIAIPCSGIYLLDMEERRMHLLKFNLGNERNNFGKYLIVFSIGIIGGAIILYFLNKLGVFLY